MGDGTFAVAVVSVPGMRVSRTRRGRGLLSGLLRGEVEAVERLDAGDVLVSAALGGELASADRRNVEELLDHAAQGELDLLRGGGAAVLGADLLELAVQHRDGVLLVLGAWRNDQQIEHNMGTASAEVLSAGPRRSTIEFVTPDRVTYRPELGVLYPSELETGMRIYVEYDRSNPDLVRVQNRNASLAVIPAGSIAVVGWLVAGVLLGIVTLVQRRLG